jgi:hypothetical protein
VVDTIHDTIRGMELRIARDADMRRAEGPLVHLEPLQLRCQRLHSGHEGTLLSFAITETLAHGRDLVSQFGHL